MKKNKRLFNGMLDKDLFKDVFWSVVLRCVLCEGHPGFHWRVLIERCHKKSCVLCKQAEHNMMCKINKPSTYMRWNLNSSLLWIDVMLECFKPRLRPALLWFWDVIVWMGLKPVLQLKTFFVFSSLEKYAFLNRVPLSELREGLQK